MIYSVEWLVKHASECATEVNGRWVPARPLWSAIGRWRHAWWVLTGRCDAVWWPEDGNPYMVPKRGPDRFGHSHPPDCRCHECLGFPQREPHD